MPFADWENRIAVQNAEEPTLVLGVSVLEVDGASTGINSRNHTSINGMLLSYNLSQNDFSDRTIEGIEYEGVEYVSPGVGAFRRETLGTYDPDALGGYGSTIIHNDKMFGVAGGRAFGLPSLGVERYDWWWRDVPYFTGGVVSGSIPAARTLNVDWGNDQSMRETTYYQRMLPSPISQGGQTQAIYIEQQISTNDPNGFNTRLIGFMLPGDAPDGYPDEFLTSSGETGDYGYTTVNVVDSDDPVWNRWYIPPQLTTMDPVPETYAWSLAKLSDEEASDTKNVLVKWTPTHLYSSSPEDVEEFPVVGEANCTIYKPYLSGLPGTSEPLSLQDYVYGYGNIRAVSAGFLVIWGYTPEGEDTFRLIQILVDPTWTTWQEIVPQPNEEGLCDYFRNNPNPYCELDRNGYWIFFLSGYTDENDNEFPPIYAYSDPSLEWTGFVCPTEPPDPDPDPGTIGPIGDNPTMRAWGFSVDGHDFYVLHLGTESTLVYDITTGQWSEWASPDATNWRANTGMTWLGMGTATLTSNANNRAVIGDMVSGLLWTIDTDQGYDENPSTGAATEFTRQVTGGIPMRLRETERLGAAYLTASIGSPQITGASITLETSDDGGKNWQDHGFIVASTTDTVQEFVWRSLGLIKAPGKVFRITDNGASVRIDSLDMR